MVITNYPSLARKTILAIRKREAGNTFVFSSALFFVHTHKEHLYFAGFLFFTLSVERFVTLPIYKHIWTPVVYNKPKTSSTISLIIVVMCMHLLILPLYFSPPFSLKKPTYTLFTSHVMIVCIYAWIYIYYITCLCTSDAHHFNVAKSRQFLPRGMEK